MLRGRPDDDGMFGQSGGFNFILALGIAAFLSAFGLVVSAVLANRSTVLSKFQAERARVGVQMRLEQMISTGFCRKGSVNVDAAKGTAVLRMPSLEGRDEYVVEGRKISDRLFEGKIEGVDVAFTVDPDTQKLDDCFIAGSTEHLCVRVSGTLKDNSCHDFKFACEGNSEKDCGQDIAEACPEGTNITQLHFLTEVNGRLNCGCRKVCSVP